MRTHLEFRSQQHSGGPNSINPGIHGGNLAEFLELGLADRLVPPLCPERDLPVRGERRGGHARQEQHCHREAPSHALNRGHDVSRSHLRKVFPEG